MASRLSRNQIRALLAVSAAAVVVILIATVSVFVLGEERTVRPFGRALSIAVVAPVEKEVLPGETMEVGTLRDGFDRAALDRATAPTLEDSFLPPDAYVGASWDGPDVPRMPAPTPASDDPAQRAYRHVVERHIPDSRAADPLADGSQLFGFDKLPQGSSADREQVLPVATPSTTTEARGPSPHPSE